MNQLITPVVLVCNDEYFLPYALEASRGFFKRYVIYDVGSSDRTRDVINWFHSSNPQATFYVRVMPMLAPSIQGVFRNSMIAETLSEYYFILDGDEVYSPESYEAIVKGAETLLTERKLYGLVRRIEVNGDMKSAYGLGMKTQHHRLYHRTAIWTGPHPGEAPYFPQKPAVEEWIEGATCYHFHNCERSSRDEDVPKRIERRARPTYRPGEAAPLDLLGALPLLKNPIADFAPTPRLALMQ